MSTFGARALTMRGRLAFSNFTEKLADTNLPKFGNSRSLEANDANTSLERNICCHYKDPETGIEFRLI